MWGLCPHKTSYVSWIFLELINHLEIFECCSDLVRETNCNTGFVHRLHVKRVGSHIETITENSNNTVSHEYCCDFEISVHEEFHYYPNVTLTIPNISQFLPILNVCSFDNFLLHQVFFLQNWIFFTISIFEHEMRQIMSVMFSEGRLNTKVNSRVKTPRICFCF